MAKQEDRIVSLVNHNKLQEAMSETDEYLNRYKNDNYALSWGYNSKGSIFSAMHEYTKAIYAYQESLKKFKLFNQDGEHKDNMRILLQNIGDLQHALGDYTDAISYYEEGIHVMGDPRRYIQKSTSIDSPISTGYNPLDSSDSCIYNIIPKQISFIFYISG